MRELPDLGPRQIYAIKRGDDFICYRKTKSIFLREWRKRKGTIVILNCTIDYEIDLTLTVPEGLDNRLTTMSLDVLLGLHKKAKARTIYMPDNQIYQEDFLELDIELKRRELNP